MKCFSAILFILVSCVFGDTRITEDNLKEGTLFKGSESAQGIGLYCIHHGLTTINSMVLMDKERSKILATIPVRSTYSTPKKHRNWLTVKWNAQGSLVAIHDALDKHSKVLIFWKTKTGDFTPVALPDMLKIEGGGRLGLDVDSIASSGQEPDQWTTQNLLMVKYRFKTKGGKTYRRTLPIFVDDSGKHKPQ